MFRYIVLLVIITLVSACTGLHKPEKQTDYTIDITVDNDASGLVYLKKFHEGKWLTLDSTRIINRNFSFSGKVLFPERYYIQIPQTMSLVPVFVEGSDIIVNIDLDTIDNTMISGSSSNDEYEMFLDKLASFESKALSYINQYEKAKEVNNRELMKKLDSFINVAYTKKESFIDDYINTNNSSVISPYIAYRNIFRYNLKDLESISDTLDESLSSSVYFGYLNNRIKLLRRVAVGQPFINFSMEDTGGVSHSLAEMINGKYFLIDFWSSWCSPCRRQNPKLVALYNKYKDNGFDILGVSLDSERDKWILAIHVDSLPWMQVSDLQSWKNNASKLYGVLSIPSNVLFDPNGKIIARNLNVERLSSKLEEIFGI